MLTCINPDITFSSPSSTQKVRGFAVSLKWLCGLVRNSGNIPPREEPVRREIESFEVGAIGNKKQYFNKNADGQTICRGAEGVEVISRKCIFVNHSDLLRRLFHRSCSYLNTIQTLINNPQAY